MQYRHIITTLALTILAGTSHADIRITDAERLEAHIAASHRVAECEERSRKSGRKNQLSTATLTAYYKSMRRVNNARHSTALDILKRADCYKKLYYY